jgi:hypothetical protein
MKGVAASPRSSARTVFQVGDNVTAFADLFEMKGHVVVGNESLGVGKPLLQRLIVPDDSGFLESFRILKESTAPATRP